MNIKEDASNRGGYRDMNMTLGVNAHGETNPQGHISELQLHIGEFLDIKAKSGHDTYEYARRLHAFGRWRRYASGADSVVATRGTFNKKTCISSTMTILMPIALLCREYHEYCLSKLHGTLRCF